MKNGQTKFRAYSRTGGHVELTSRQRKSRANQDVTGFECQQPRYFKNECPKLIPKRKFSREKNKVLMDTWDDSESLEDDFEEEQVHMALMASSKSSDSRSELDSDSNEVFSNLNHSEVESCLTKILERFQSL